MSEYDSPIAADTAVSVPSTGPRLGDLYVYRDEDGNAISVAMYLAGANGGWKGREVARMSSKWDDGPRNGFAAMFAAAADLRSVVEHYQLWEADLILNADWSSDTPRLTQRQMDWLHDIQVMRNRAIAKASGANASEPAQSGTHRPYEPKNPKASS